MVVVVFRSRLRDGNTGGFQELASELLELAESMPGFVSYKVYTSEDGERCSIIEFASREQLLDWRNHPRHREAQQLGREQYYEAYSLQVGEAIRESSFER